MSALERALQALWQHPHMAAAPWAPGADLVAHLQAGPRDLYALAADFLDAWADRRDRRPHERQAFGTGLGSPFADVDDNPAAAREAAARYRRLASTGEVTS